MASLVPDGFGTLLRRFRERLDLSQGELAERAGLSVDAISTLERGVRRQPQRETARRLADALGLHDPERTEFLGARRRPGPWTEPADRFPSVELTSSLSPAATFQRSADTQNPAARGGGAAGPAANGIPGRDIAQEPLRRHGGAPARGIRNPTAARRHNLPAQLTSFVGRKAELAALPRLLQSGRLVTLSGAGGCGKTRLALAAAERLLGDYPDGSWLVELAPLSDPALVPRAVADALGLREAASGALADLLGDVLGPRRLLLILDNCEHLIESCARLVSSLLSGGGNLRVLATSREPLGIPGEVVQRVAPLAVPPDGRPAAPAELWRTDAVQLFLERAKAAAPSFALTEQNAAVVAQICRCLDGVPLALELAAARLGVLSVDRLAERLDQRFLLLTGGSRTALPRHQTLAALVSWSYDLLPEPERRLFDRLSVFVGGFTLEAAEAVCAEAAECWVLGTAEEKGDLPPGPRTQYPAATLDLLQHLVDKSLVVADQGPNGTERYRLLETLRQFGQAKLAEREEATEIQRRHARYFLDRADQPERWMESSGFPAWLASLEPEQGNLRQVLRWALGDGQHPGADLLLGLRLICALGLYWFTRGPQAEGRDWAVAALERAPDAPLAQRAEVAIAGALNAMNADDLDAAGRLAEEGIRLGQAARDTRSVALGHFCLGSVVFFLKREYARGEGLLQESLRLFQQLNDRHWIAAALSQLARAALSLRDFDRAERLLAEAGPGFRQSDPAGLPVAIWTGYVGMVALYRGDLNRAIALHQEALAQCRRLGNGLMAGSSLSGLGIALQLQGDLAGAVALYCEAMAEWYSLGFLWGVADCFQRLATIAATRGERARAARLMGVADRLGFPTPPFAPHFDRDRYDECVDQVCAAMGDPAFAAAFADGRALRLDDAVALARADSDRPTTVKDHA
jgi:non-specific serine/threonine protein kinase